MIIWILPAVLGALVGVLLFRAIYRARREARRRRMRVVEKPNSYYTPKLVRDREDRDRWQGISLDAIHEVNRGEVKQLLDRVEALGIDSLTQRERTFLDQLARTSVPAPKRTRGGRAGATPDDSRRPPYPPLSPHVRPGESSSRP